MKEPIAEISTKETHSVETFGERSNKIAEVAAVQKDVGDSKSLAEEPTKVQMGGAEAKEESDSVQGGAKDTTSPAPPEETTTETGGVILESAKSSPTEETKAQASAGDLEEAQENETVALQEQALEEVVSDEEESIESVANDDEDEVADDDEVADEDEVADDDEGQTSGSENGAAEADDIDAPHEDDDSIAVIETNGDGSAKESENVDEESVAAENAMGGAEATPSPDKDGATQQDKAPALPLMEELSDAESDAMDSGDDELSLDALLGMQQEALEAKRKFEKLKREREEAKRNPKGESAADRNAAVKEMMLAMEEAKRLDEQMQGLMLQRATRDRRRQNRLAKRAKPRRREMGMNGLNPEYKLSFSDNLKFRPFQLMKGPASVPQWGADDAMDESDGPDSEEEEEELARWRKEKEKMKGIKVTETGQSLGSSFLYESNPVQLPDGWEYGPPMVQTQHPLWKKWFKVKEKKIMAWEQLEIEEEEIDKEAKLLEAQKNANKMNENDGEEILTRAQKRQKKKARATKLWGKLRAHTKSKWRMSRALRKSRLHTVQLESLESGKTHVDTIPFGETPNDEMSAYKYFAIDVMDSHSIITITLLAQKGDPDIYVSTTILPTKNDYTWSATTIGKSRVVIYPTDKNFVVGRYVLGVYSRVPAKFKIDLDITGGTYTSASLDTVVMMTNKFNTIAEGFDRAEEKRIVKAEKPRERKMSVEERAQQYLDQQHEAELLIARLKREAAIVIQAETRNTSKKMKKIEKDMRLANRDSTLAKAFYRKLSENASLEYNSDDDDTDEESEAELVEEDPIAIDVALAAELEAKELEEKKKADLVLEQGYMSNVSEDTEGELSSEAEEEGSEADRLYGSVKQMDPMKLYRPMFGLTPNQKKDFQMRHEVPKYKIPKPSFADKRKNIEKALRVRAELAVPKRASYSTRKLGKRFKPSRTKKEE